MSDKKQYVDAYNTILDDRVEQFFNKYQRYPNATEELQMEATITEDELRDSLERVEDEDNGYDY